MDLFQQIFGSGQAADLGSIINEKSFLVDVRTPVEFAEGSVKGAVNIPLDSIPTALGRFKDKDNIVVFCRSGSRSSMAKTILENNNIPNVVNGGSWQYVSRFVK